MLRNPREGKVGEAVADFPLKFPQQAHLFTWLFHVQTQGHAHQKRLILLWMHRRVGNKPPGHGQGGGSSSMRSAGSCSLKHGAPTPRRSPGTGARWNCRQESPNPCQFREEWSFPRVDRAGHQTLASPPGRGELGWSSERAQGINSRGIRSFFPARSS